MAPIPLPATLGLLGLGTVGSEVARILLERSPRIERRAGRPIELRRAVVRDPGRSRALALPGTVLATDPGAVLDDPEIQIVIEVMGGLEPARSWILRALDAGKDVVTANKALLSEYGTEIFSRARARGRTVAFEAAVAGGIPVVSCLGTCLTANRVVGLEAILNGTTNFILTGMAATGRGYAEVLGEAQERGYAEADPTMDVDGTDATQKLALLLRLAFGATIPWQRIPRSGIEGLEATDLEYARELGYAVKLLAVARRIDGHLQAAVRPTLIRRDRPIARVDGADNMIALEGDSVGWIRLSGAGAGGRPTASAVVADVIDTVAGRSAITFPRLDLDHEESIPLQPAAEERHRYYLRFDVEDRPHVFADIASILGRQGISLASIIQREAPEPSGGAPRVVPVVVMTHETSWARLHQAGDELDRLPALRARRRVLPVLG